MSYQIQILPSAQRELARLPERERKRVDKRIQSLASEPRPSGTKTIQGSKGLLRLRVGDYRVIYETEDDQLVVIVVKVGHRSKVYRQL